MLVSPSALQLEGLRLNCTYSLGQELLVYSLLGRMQFAHVCLTFALVYVAGGLGSLILSNVVYQAYVTSQTTAIAIPYALSQLPCNR